MKILYKFRFALIAALTVFAMLRITCGTSQARGPVPTATPMPTATPTPIPEGWTPDDTYQPTSAYRVTMIRARLQSDPESGYAGCVVNDWENPTEVILVLTEDADREAILEAWPKDIKLQIIDAKYSMPELEAVRFDIDKNWHYSIGKNGNENIVIGTVINERENFVNVHIDRAASERIKKKVIADLFERYGDCIRIDASMSREEMEVYEYRFSVDDYVITGNSANEEYYNYKPNPSLLTFTEYANNREAYEVMPRGVIVAIALALGAAIVALAYTLRRQNARVTALADGRTFVSGSYSDADIEALVKSAGGDVSDAGRERIFAAYERERGNR